MSCCAGGPSHQRQAHPAAVARRGAAPAGAVQAQAYAASGGEPLAAAGAPQRGVGPSVTHWLMRGAVWWIAARPVAARLGLLRAQAVTQKGFSVPHHPKLVENRVPRPGLCNMPPVAGAIFTTN